MITPSVNSFKDTRGESALNPLTYNGLIHASEIMIPATKNDL